VWRVINSGVLLAGAFVFVRTVFPGRPRLTETSAALLAALLLPLSVGSLNNGQPNSLIAGCLLLGLSAILAQRWWLAAVCLAVPVLFKVYPVAVILLLLLGCPVRLGWRIGLCVVVGLLLPLAFKDADFVSQLYASWVDQVAGDNRHDRALEKTYRDFHLLMRCVGWQVSEKAYQVLQLAAAGLAAATVLRGRWCDWSRVLHLRAALDLGCCWIMLFGPATESCTYALLAPTLALAAWEAFQPGQAAWKRWCMIAMVGQFAAAMLVAVFPFGSRVSFFLLPLGALLLFAERLAHYARHGVANGPAKAVGQRRLPGLSGGGSPALLPPRTYQGS
jgi:hypothetical protein